MVGGFFFDGVANHLEHPRPYSVRGIVPEEAALRVGVVVAALGREYPRDLPMDDISVRDSPAELG